MTKLKAFWGKINYETTCFIILVMSVFANIDRTDFDPWDVYPYVGDYSHGIADKFLAGEIVSWFTDYVPVQKIFDIATMLGILLCVLLSVFSGQAIRHSSQENQKAVVAVVFLFWLIPPGVGGLLRFIGVPDIFMVLALILCIVLSKNNFLYWLVPFVSAAAVGFHQIYTVLFFPTLFVAMYYFALQLKHNVPRMCVAVLTLITTFISFVFITFFSKDYLTFEGVEYLISYLNSKSDINFAWDFLPWLFEGQYFSDVAAYAAGAMTMLFGLKEIIRAFIAFLPLILLISCVYIKALRISADKTKKFLFFLCSISWVPSIIMCFLMKDIFRIYVALWITQFLMTSLFLYFRDEDFLKAFDWAKSLVSKYRMALLAYMLFIFLFKKWI